MDAANRLLLDRKDAIPDWFDLDQRRLRLRQLHVLLDRRIAGRDGSIHARSAKITSALRTHPEITPQRPHCLAGVGAVKPIGALIHDPAEIEGTMSVLGSGADGGLIVLPDAFTDVHREQIIALAARYRVPTIYSYRYFTAAGVRWLEAASPCGC